MKLDQSALTFEKVVRKLAKHSVWLLIALVTGGAWIMYFNDAPTVVRNFFTGEAGAAVYGFVGLFASTTYLLAGWAREQVCIYMCPWPRFQAAMFDEHTTLVTYEEWRGEPRGKAKIGASFEGRGHCIDCGLCVRVCPTGVDIRKGQQLACIGCALCVDACNSVMSKIGLPGDLITYDSIANQEARARGDTPKLRFVRPRTVIYAALLALAAALMVFSLATRATVEVSVQPDRAPLFVTLSDGGIRNGYTFKILNKDRARHNYQLSVEGIPGAELTVIGFQDNPAVSATLPVAGDTVGSFRVFVRAPRENLDGQSTSLTLVATDEATGKVVSHETVFRGPGR
jgi:cytochrome c oxidase accessory protein FixG